MAIKMRNKDKWRDMEVNIIENIKEDIKTRCESPNNFFGSGSYEHIESVANNSVELAIL